MEALIITKTEEFQRLKPEWDALLEESGQNNLFLDFNWLFCRWHFLEQQSSLFIIITRDKGRLVGIAPFMILKKGRLPRLAFIGEGISDYEDVIATGDIKKREEIILSIFTVIEKSKLWNIFQLKGIQEDSPNLPIFKKLCAEYRKKINIFIHSHRDGAPYIKINEKWESYCGRLRKKIIADSKRQKNRLEKDFPGIRFEHISDASQAQNCLGELAKFHRLIRKKKNNHSIFDEDKNLNFFRELAVMMLKSGKFIFSVLRTEKQLAALHMGFADKDIFYYYIPAYNPEFGRYSIGRLLLIELMKYVFEHNFQRFDFMLGQEDYKQEWAANVQNLYFINAFSGGLPANIASLFTATKLRAKKILGKKW